MTHNGAHQGGDRSHRTAPHVDERWAEAFVLELRVLGVSGARVGEALAEVESHCAESGEDPGVAFGHPVAYARSLGERGEAGTAEVARAVAPTMLQVVGLVLTVWAVPSLLAGTPAALTTGHIATAVLLIVAGGVLVLAADAVLRAVVHHPVLATLGFVALVWLMVALLLLLAPVAVTLSAASLTWAGLAALAAGTIWHLLARRPGRALADDPVTMPFGEQPFGDQPSGEQPGGVRSAGEQGAGSSRLSRAVGAFTPWLVPAVAAVSVATAFALRG